MADERTTCASASSCSQESCEGCPSANGGPESFLEELNEYSSVKKVIGVVSGKGGVGKSFVTASLASALSRAGYAVGILDADVTGPSIPKMYGLKAPAPVTEMGVTPLESADGVKVMSVNLLLQDETAPVVWRGPVISGVVKQFWTDVVWGDLDFLLVDMPPGTGDVALTVFQSIPVDGLMIVTSPQSLVHMIVKKALHMAQMMNIPVLGLIENFSYMECPDCGKKISVFGESNVDEAAEDMKIPVLGKLPINPGHARLADRGAFALAEVTGLEAAIKVLEEC